MDMLLYAILNKKIKNSGGSGSQWIDIPLEQTGKLGEFASKSYLKYKKYGKIVEVCGKLYPVDASSVTSTRSVVVAKIPDEIKVPKVQSGTSNIIKEMSTAYNSNTKKSGRIFFLASTDGTFKVGADITKEALTWTHYEYLHLMYSID